MEEELKIDVKVNGYFSEHYEQVQRCCFFPKLRMVVSIDLTSKPCEAIIWDVDTRMCIKKIEIMERLSFATTSFVMKWDDDSFLCCFSNASIRCFSIKTFKMVKEVYRWERTRDRDTRSGDFIFMKKISDDLFFCTNWGRSVKMGKIMTISYSRGEVVKRLRQPVSSYSLLVQSNQYPKSLYFNCYISETRDIRLINFETNKVIKSFDRHDDQIRSMSISTNLQSKEILIAGSCSRIYFYSTSTSQQDQLIAEIEVESDVNSILKISKRFFATSHRDGSIQIWNSQTLACLTRNVIHKRMIASMCGIDLKGHSGSIVLVTSSSDKTLAVVSISGIPLDSDSFEQKDLFERVDFLRTYSDYVDVGKMIISLSLIHRTKWNIFRSFLI